MNRVLIFGCDEKRKVAEVIAFAKSNRLSRETVSQAHQQFMKGDPVRAIGDDPRYRCEIPNGFRVVYSEEYHPGGLMRHLSVSVDAKGKSPSMPAMELIMAEFGFKYPSPLNPKVLTFMEEFPGGTSAINVMEKYEEVTS